jgi:UDP-N-acetylmuramoyl-tripeptide--D-alanyl-D-alanine ligase
VLREKGMLLRLLPPGGTAVVGGDDRRLSGFARRLDVPVSTFGTRNGNDHRARDIVLDGFGRPSFLFDGGTLARLPAVGGHNVANAMAAVAVGRIFGLPEEEIARGLEDACIPEMRTQLVEKEGVRLLIDCYNANPASMQTSIRTLRSIKARRRIAVLGPMAELGRRSKPLHRRVGEEAARSGVDMLIGVGEGTQCYLEGAESYARRKNLQGPDLRLFETAEEAYELLAAMLERGDVVLFKASRSAGLERLVRMIREGSGPGTAGEE